MNAPAVPVKTMGRVSAIWITTDVHVPLDSRARTAKVGPVLECLDFFKGSI